MQGMNSYASPEFSRSYYVEPNANTMQNFQSSNMQQAQQLNAAALLPQSFMTGRSCGPHDELDWYKCAPTKAGFENFLIASGSRMPQMEQTDYGSKLGTPNLLRPPPPSPLSASSSDPWFNNSSFRSDLLASYRNQRC